MRPVLWPCRTWQECRFLYYNFLSMEICQRTFPSCGAAEPPLARGQKRTTAFRGETGTEWLRMARRPLVSRLRMQRYDKYSNLPNVSTTFYKENVFFSINNKESLPLLLYTLYIIYARDDKRNQKKTI